MSKINELLPLVHAPVVGQKYHVSWGNSHGVVGVCMAVHVHTQEVILRSPKTKVLWKNPVKWADLRHIRKDEKQCRHVAQGGHTS